MNRERKSIATSPHLRVLIVDDMPQVRQELGLLLTLSGKLQIIGEAADGAEAIRKCDQLHPDVVLMDLEMPVMDGYLAAREISVRQPGCSVVALSVHSGSEEQLRASRCGVKAFIEKGTSLEKIIKTIQKIRR